MYFTIDYWVKVFIGHYRQHKKEIGRSLIYQEVLHRKDIPCELCKVEGQKFFDRRLGSLLETKKHPFEDNFVVHFFDG